MGDLLAEPASAVRVEVDPSGGLRLIAAGSEPVEIPGPAGIRGSLVAWGDGDTVLDTWPVRPPSATDPLILAPGDSVVLDADGPAKPVGDARLSGGLELDLRVGDRNRHVTVRTPAP